MARKTISALPEVFDVSDQAVMEIEDNGVSSKIKLSDLLSGMVPNGIPDIEPIESIIADINLAIANLFAAYDQTVSAADSAAAALLARDAAVAQRGYVEQLAADTLGVKNLVLNSVSSIATYSVAAQQARDDAQAAFDAAEGARDSAISAASAAAVSATNAQGSATSAAGSATNSASSATAAGLSATSASASANLASIKATEAQTSADAASTSSSAATASQTAAGISASAAQNSEVSARIRAAAIGQTANAEFTEGVNGWTRNTNAQASDALVTLLTAAANYQGAATVALNSGNTRRDLRGSVASYDSLRKYRLKARFYSTAANRTVFGITRFDSTGAFVSTAAIYDQTAAVGWTAINQVITAHPAGVTSHAPYGITNFNANTATVAVDYLYLEDVTESESAASAASASATSASSAAAAQTAASNSASAAQTSATNAASAATSANGYAGQASTSAGQASTSASNANASASTAATSATNAANSASAAGTAATAATNSASSASTAASAAGTSATAANQSKLDAAAASQTAQTASSNAQNAVTSATTQASAAANSAVLASTYATNAGTSATNAASSATVAGQQATIATQQASAAQSSAALAATYSTAGGNLISDTDFAVDPVQGWGTSFTAGGVVTFQRDLAGDAWRPVGEHVLGIYQANNNTGTDSYWYTNAIIIEPNKYYEASAWVASHRCNVRLAINVHDKDGVYLTQFATAPTAAFSGGSALSPNATQGNGYGRIFVKFQVPANAGRLIFHFHKYATASGQPDSYGWLLRPQIREVLANTPSPTMFDHGRMSNTASNMAASINTIQSAVATANSSIATLQTRLIAGSPNLIANGGFENGFSGWVVGGGTWGLFNGNGWGMYAYTGSQGTSWMNGPWFDCYPNTQYTVSADSAIFASSGSVYVDILYFDATGTVLLGDGGQNPRSASHDFSSDNSGRALIAHTSTAPANSTRAYPRIVVANASGLTSAGFRQVKVERGVAWTPYTGEASAIQQAAVVADHSGKLQSYLELISAAGSASASVRLRAIYNGVNYSSVELQAEEISLYNGGTRYPAMRVVGGNVQIYGKLQANVIEANMIIANQIQTYHITGGSVTANQVATAPDKYCPTGVSTSILETGWYTIGDGSYGSGIISISFTYDSTIQKDGAALFQLYVDTGGGWQLGRNTSLGIRTNNGDTTHRISGQLQTVVSGSVVRVLAYGTPGQYIPGSENRPFYTRDIVMTLMGAKR